MEKLLQYAWQHRFWTSPEMTATDGTKFTVLDPGWLNSGAGPDFFNAKIVADGKEWVGNIEIHLKASDWYRHGHDTDPAYNSVILHVVDDNDTSVTDSAGRPVMQSVFRCDNKVVDFYNMLLTSGTLDLPCREAIRSIPRLFVNNWIDALAYERLYNKCERFNGYLHATGGDYEQALFVAIARAVGFGRNSEILERAALATPLKILAKHADSPTAVEAIIFGQASLLPPKGTSPYADTLISEYAFMSHKFNLRPPATLNWNFGRMRPQNLPYRRLAALARMVTGGFRYMTSMLEARSVEDLKNLFRIYLQGHWATSLTFSGTSGGSPVAFSESAINSLIINAAIPAIHSFLLQRGENGTADSALDFLRQMPAEDNSVTRMFVDAGLQCSDAYTSQALIELRRVYCEARKCLFCRIGYRMLR